MAEPALEPGGRTGGGMISVDIGVPRGDFALELAATFGAGITGVFGPSGSGKSTLLLAIAGLLTPQRGRIAVGDCVFVDRAVGALLPAHRRRIGLVFQEGLLFPHYSVAGNLQYGERLLPPADRRIGFDRVVELLRLAPLLERRPATLSGGERQRVALGRALLTSPRLLLCDEPLNAIDRRHRADILPYFRQVTAELAIPMLYVSHDLGEVLALTEQVAVLDGGRLAGHGHIDALAADPLVRPLLYDEAVLTRFQRTS